MPSRALTQRGGELVLAGPIARVVVEEVLDGLVDVVGLGRSAGDPRDEGGRVVDVVARRHGVGVLPEGVALLVADGIRHGLPHRGGLAQAARAQLESDQGRERGLGRSTRGAPTSHGLGDGGG